MLDAALAIDADGASDTDASDADGGGIDLALTVRNAGDAPDTLRFRTGQRADFAAYRIDDTDSGGGNGGRENGGSGNDGGGNAGDGGSADPVWRYGTGRLFTQVLGSETLEPGESVTYEATWGDPPPGRYRFVGEVTAEEHDLTASAVARVSA